LAINASCCWSFW